MSILSRASFNYRTNKVVPVAFSYHRSFTLVELEQST
jgi:hypothetical protein